MVDKIGTSNVRPLRPLNPAVTGAGTAAASGRAATPDSADLSDRARQLSQARGAARLAPDIRTERVDILRQRIAAGTYHVPDSLLAQKILDFRA